MGATPAANPRRPLHSYSSAVLAEFIQRKGISYFDEELEAIEERHAKEKREQTAREWIDHFRRVSIL